MLAMGHVHRAGGIHLHIELHLVVVVVEHGDAVGEDQLGIGTKPCEGGLEAQGGGGRGKGGTTGILLRILEREQHKWVARQLASTDGDPDRLRGIDLLVGDHLRRVRAEGDGVWGAWHHVGHEGCAWRGTGEGTKGTIYDTGHPRCER